MPLEIQEVSSKRELVSFIKFPFSLYKGNENYVPPIIDFELSTLRKEKNPAFENAESKYWVAKKDGQIAGRIAGIKINQEFEEKSLIRFGWVDFVDDIEVSTLLFDQLIAWAKGLKAEGIHGPLGFTDLDFEGSLVSGFDQLATQATIYNFPYYADHYERLGLNGTVDWLEIRGPLAPKLPERTARVASVVKSRSKFTIKEFKKTKEIIRYAKGVFNVINESYTDLYGYYNLSEKQIEYYINLYFGFIRKEFVCIVVDEADEVAAIALCMPSLSKAFQKAKGSLLPFGFIHVLKAFRSNKHADMFLIGVRPKYQKVGINALIFQELQDRFTRIGVEYLSTGPMLESNTAVLSLWKEFMDGFDDVSIRRRCYSKKLDYSKLPEPKQPKSMSLEIHEVITKKELKAFIKFPFSLYKGNKYYVPPLIDFEMSTLRKDKNPAFEHADAAYWVVKKEGKIVGRIAGIKIDQELEEKSLIRFGWVDFIDDIAVTKMLFGKLSEWGKGFGATKFHGPLGFTDLDFEGALTSGFDQQPTQATIYNHAYYIDHFKELGYQTSASWIEFRAFVPKEVPRRIARSAQLVGKRFNFTLKKFKKTKDILKYAPGVFEILNESYAHLYAYHALSEKQIQYYIDQYFGFIRKEYVGIVVNEKDEVIAMALCMPSLSTAFQKAKGSLFPFGFIHVLKAFYSNEYLDLFLIGARPDYQKLGATAVIFNELTQMLIDKKVKYVSTGPMLLENRAAINNWESNKEILDDVDITRSCFSGEIL
ncbi:MAG: hypothetical protein ABJG78_04730 [Cyclobacteriaceae bacterium]